MINKDVDNNNIFRSYSDYLPQLLDDELTTKSCTRIS